MVNDMLTTAEVLFPQLRGSLAEYQALEGERSGRDEETDTL